MRAALRACGRRLQQEQTLPHGVRSSCSGPAGASHPLYEAAISSRLGGIASATDVLHQAVLESPSSPPFSAATAAHAAKVEQHPGEHASAARDRQRSALVRTL